jgi:hypothetical protein
MGEEAKIERGEWGDRIVKTKGEARWEESRDVA